MQTDIKIHPELPQTLRSAVERQLNFTLASLHWQVGRLTVELEPIDAGTANTGGQDGFSCRLQAELRVGRAQVITVINSDPQICVADAAARLRRIVKRDKQLGLMGRAS